MRQIKPQWNKSMVAASIAISLLGAFTSTQLLVVIPLKSSPLLTLGLQDVSSENLCPNLEYPDVDYSWQSDLRLLLDMEPSLCRDARVRVGPTGRHRRAVDGPKLYSSCLLHVCRTRDRFALGNTAP